MYGGVPFGALKRRVELSPTQIGLGAIAISISGRGLT